MYDGLFLYTNMKLASQASLLLCLASLMMCSAISCPKSDSCVRDFYSGQDLEPRKLIEGKAQEDFNISYK